jgi:putative transposase
MWLSVADIAKKERVSIRTIQRRVKKGFYHSDHIKEEPSPGHKGFTYKIFYLNCDNCDTTAKKAEKLNCDNYDNCDTIATSKKEMSQYKKTNCDTEIENCDIKINCDTIVTQNDQICKTCKSSHPECDNCCKLCNEKCNSEQICEITNNNDLAVDLTGQEKKPELVPVRTRSKQDLTHKGADSSPAPASSLIELNNNLNLINNNINNAEPDQSELLNSDNQPVSLITVPVSPLPDLVPHPDLPEEYIEIGRMKAVVCLEVIKKIDSGMKKLLVYETITEAFNIGLIVPDLLEKNGRLAIRTLQGWLKKYLDNEKDFMALAPQYLAAAVKGRSITNKEEQFLIKYLLNPRKIMIGSAIRKMKQLSELGYIESPSSNRTLRRAAEDIKQKYYKEWGLLREGEKFFDEHINKTILRDWSMIGVGDVWFADGHVLNFDIINPLTGKPKRMILVTFFDVACRMPLGATIQPTENTRGIALAFRNAVLNWGNVPKIVYIDNGRAFKSKFFTGTKEKDLEMELAGLYERLGCKVIFSKAYNGKAKSQLERWHGTLDTDLQKFLPSYRGSSIDNKPSYLHRNEKFIKKIFNNDPLTIEEAHQFVDFYVSYLYGKTPHKGLNGAKPIEVLKQFPPQERIDAGTLNYLMLDTEIKKINNNGIKFNGMFYWHRALVGYTRSVHIKYDWNDLRSVLVYSDKGHFICQAITRAYQHPAAKHLGNKFDEASLKRETKELANLKKQSKQSALELLGRAGGEELDFAKIVKQENKPAQIMNNSNLIEHPDSLDPDNDNDYLTVTEDENSDFLLVTEEKKSQPIDYDKIFEEEHGFTTD